MPARCRPLLKMVYENRLTEVWKFFDLKVCLTTSPSLWDRAKSELDNTGMQGVQPFFALPGKDSFNSFNRSEKAIIEQFLDSGAWHLLHLEDDIVLKEWEHLPTAISELPQHWDILYLGANLVGSDQTRWPAPRKHSQHLYKVKHAWTTHAVAYRRRVAEFIRMDYDAEKDGMFDAYLCNKILHRFSAYVVSPMVAWQRPRFSELWNRDVDYDECYSQSQARLL